MNFKLPLSAPMRNPKSIQVGSFIYHAKLESFDFEDPYNIKKPFILYRQMFVNGTLYPAEAYDLNASEHSSLGSFYIYYVTSTEVTKSLLNQKIALKSKRIPTLKHF